MSELQRDGASLCSVLRVSLCSVGSPVLSLSFGHFCNMLVTVEGWTEKTTIE